MAFAIIEAAEAPLPIGSAISLTIINEYNIWAYRSIRARRQGSSF